MSGLRVDETPGQMVLTLDRPQKANALSAELVDALTQAVVRADAGELKVLVLRGQGSNFSAGFDFSGYEMQSEGDLLLRFVRIETLLQAVADSRCLTVGLAHGQNFGAGVDLFAACRIRVADPQATFRMPGLAFGLVLGTLRFATLVGDERACEFLESSKTFGAEEAQRIGFVQDLVPQDAWDAVIDGAQRRASVLPQSSRHGLYRVLSSGAAQRDRSLAELVRSAAAPGLHQRIRAYLAMQKSSRTPRPRAVAER